MDVIKDKNNQHILFMVGIIIKAIDGVLELIGGILLLSVRSDSLSKIVKNIFQHEIAQDPTDILANYFIHLAQTISINTISFAAMYLIIHGLIKVGLFLGLWYKRTWAYPLAGIILSLFVIYQFIRFFNTHSIILLILTVVDIVIIILLRSEYNRLKHASMRRSKSSILFLKL